MNNLKLFGVVKDILPQRSGISQNGAQWYAQDFILELNDGRFAKEVKLSLSNNALSAGNTSMLTIGNEITVYFDLTSRAVQAKDGRVFYNTNANVWRIEEGDKTDNYIKTTTPAFAPTTQAQQPIAATADNSFAPQPASDLPF